MLLCHLFENTALPMDAQSRMRRAAELGYTIKAYHGTEAKFNEFDMEKGKGNHFGFAPFFADKKAEAKGYADRRKEETGKGHLMSVLLRIKKPFIIKDTRGVMPNDYEKAGATIPPELYTLITGGQLPHETKRERYMTGRDAIEHAMDVHYNETGNYDRKAIWTKIYARLKSQGYDAIIWEGTPSDHSAGTYSKIVMLDMSGIRLTSAKFDPAMAHTATLSA